MLKAADTYHTESVQTLRIELILEAISKLLLVFRQQKINHREMNQGIATCSLIVL